LLFLLGLGTAGLKAQVRIGSNTPPNASAVLDLNANDTNNGTLGLALPRVALTSNTMLLSGVTSNLTGMMVYNTSTTGGTGVNTRGIYYWNGTTWVSASLPSTSAADSGKILISNGSTWVASYIYSKELPQSGDTLKPHLTGIGFSLNMILDTTYVTKSDFNPMDIMIIQAPGVARDDYCFTTQASALPTSVYYAYAITNGIRLLNVIGRTIATGTNTRIRCLRLVS